MEKRFPKLNGKVKINYVSTKIGSHTGLGTVALFLGEVRELTNKKEMPAKVIRILSIPPIMVTALVMILMACRPSIFRNPAEIVITILLLGVVPIFAYPLQNVIPSYKHKGRDGQRKLAFILNLIGYTGAFVWVLVTDASDELVLVCTTYFGSVVLLTICNKLIHFKASGHASSFTGPLVLLVYFIGWKTIIPCVLAGGLIIWSSLTLKRHTKKELVGGILVCLIAFAFSLMGVILL